MKNFQEALLTTYMLKIINVIIHLTKEQVRIYEWRGSWAQFWPDYGG